MVHELGTGPIHHDRRKRRRRLNPRGMIKVLPSLFTLGNLLCGFASIFYASRVTTDPVFGHFSVLTVAASLIFLGMVFDALDGRVARMTRQTSELGEQLDSMSDMVTFGVAPAFLAVQLIGIGTPFFGTYKADTYFDRLVLVVAGVYVACCALRLARFNIEIDNPEEADHMSFKGMPSPAAAGTVASLALLHQSLGVGGAMQWWTTLALVAVTMLAAIAMVSTMRYSHLLNRYLRGRAPFEYIVAVVVIGLLLLIAPHLTLAVGLVLYALSAPVVVLSRKLRRAPAKPAGEKPAKSHDENDRPPLRIRHQ
jgi:CDP-diacylglycerol--serine O-phosphatidyltransferase